MSSWWPMKCYWSSGRTITYNFWNRTRLSVDASRNDAQGEQMVGFDFELAFLQVRSWTVNCYANFVRWKGLKTQSLLLYCPRALRFWFWKSVYGKEKGLWLFFSNHCSLPLLSLGTRIALLRKRLQLDSKSDLTTNGLILGFFVGKWLFSFTSYLCGMKSARNAQLLFFFDDIKFFRCLVGGVFWSVL